MDFVCDGAAARLSALSGGVRHASDPVGHPRAQLLDGEPREQVRDRALTSLGL